MAKIYYDKDADLSVLKGRKVAVIGYGSQGHAHALNLHDSGIDVVVGLPETSRSRAKAKADGLEVKTPAEAAAEADIVMILTPDTSQAKLYREDIAPGLKPGNTLMFAHGFNIRYGTIEPPEGVDVSMIAPKSPGHRVREVFKEGQGTPGLLAVHKDATGNAKANALAYGMGIGCTRAGVIETTFEEETETDLFGEQAVLCGGVLGPGQGRLPDPRRRRLPAGDRLLRVHARAEAHRGPHVPRRAQLHALLGLRHRRARRLHRRPAPGERRHPWRR